MTAAKHFGLVIVSVLLTGAATVGAWLYMNRPHVAEIRLPITAEVEAQLRLCAGARVYVLTVEDGRVISARVACR